MNALRLWLLKRLRGIPVEEYDSLQGRYDLCRLQRKSLEEGYDALKAENRQLKTQIKNLKIQGLKK